MTRDPAAASSLAAAAPIPRDDPAINTVLDIFAIPLCWNRWS
jgi:hypothetical protein